MLASFTTKLFVENAKIQRNTARIYDSETHFKNWWQKKRRYIENTRLVMVSTSHSLNDNRQLLNVPAAAYETIPQAYRTLICLYSAGLYPLYTSFSFEYEGNSTTPIDRVYVEIEWVAGAPKSINFYYW